ncbi:MAG: glycosyltransferase family 2 protein [Verrucomicrobiota bacterium]|nr:glycosyltransferase family 2 protein [Verrucomicrobiota bacterium]
MPNTCNRPTLAMVMSVNNEADYLKANLAYHHAVGVSRAYLFFDRCTDASEEIARQFPWVKIFKKDMGAEVEYTREHQNACCSIAIENAAKDEIDWLLHLDADELAFGESLGKGATGDQVEVKTRLGPFSFLRSRRRGDASVEPNDVRFHADRASLISMLQTVSPETVQVVLETHEAYPIALERGSDFWKNTYFQTSTPLRRKIKDPLTNRVLKFKQLLGHDYGKSIVRVSKANEIEPLNAHRWTVRQTDRNSPFPEHLPIPTELRGCHLHYLIATPAQWLAKYRRFASLNKVWPSGHAIGFPKGSWRIVADSMNEKEASDYLERWIYMSDEKLTQLAARGKALYFTEVRDIIRDLEKTHWQRILLIAPTLEILTADLHIPFF